MKSGIYCIINKINGKCYVGSATNLSTRIKTHEHKLEKNIHDNIYLQNAWNKYGKEKFCFFALEYVEKKELLNTEQYYLDLFLSYNMKHGYNINPKADSRFGAKCSNESKKKMSEANKKWRKSRIMIMSIETKKKISEANKGKTFSEETIKKMSDSAKRRGISAETRNKIYNKLKISQPWLGRKHSEESRRKMSEQAKRNMYRLGCKHSEKTKEKMSTTRRKINTMNKFKSIYCLF